MKNKDPSKDTSEGDSDANFQKREIEYKIDPRLYTSNSKENN
jgi:hypothetical protein